MASLNTVFDFLKALPEAYSHQDKYMRVMNSLSMDKAGVNRSIDLADFEESTVGVGEKNILNNLVCQDKFILPGLDAGFSMNSASISKQKGKDIGKGSMTQDSSKGEDFLAQEFISLYSSPISVNEPKKSDILVPANMPLYRTLVAAVPGLRAKELVGVGMTMAGDFISVQSDLRHLFTKGYLMLMSYNLAISSNVNDFDYDDLSVSLISGVTPEQKLAVMVRHKIAVEVDQLTNEEFWILAEMADTYPKKRFGNDTIYGSIVMEEDDLVFMTRRKNWTPAPDAGYGSPERLWNTIISIALKMDAMKDLHDVVRDMRGMPFLMHDVNKLTGETEFFVKYPKSKSRYLAYTPMGIRKPMISKHSCYYATTKNLLCDLYLGKMLMMSTYNLIEELGALGMVGCPSRTPISDSFFNSNLRNRGLKNDDSFENELLCEWRGVTGTPIEIRFNGKVKEYVAKMAQNILDGEIGFLRPQLLFALPYSRYRGTTWATIRGWKSEAYQMRLKAEDRVRSNLVTKAYSWVMGVETSVPLISINGYGVVGLDMLNANELKFYQCAVGDYEISIVQHRIEGNCLPRLDEMELGPSVFYKSSFPGCRCSVVFTESGGVSLIYKQGIREENAGTTLGTHRFGTRKARTTFGGSVVMPSSSVLFGYNSQPIGSETVNGSGVRTSNASLLDGLLVGGTENPEVDSGTKEVPVVVPDPPQNQDKSAPEVEITSEPGEKIKVGPNLGIKIVDGQLVMPEVTTRDGDVIKTLFPPELDDLAGSFSGDILNTPGDGRCGFHALVQDMKAHGFVAADQSDAVMHDLVGKSLGSREHTFSELAFFANNMNFGLRVIDAASKSVYNIGTVGSWHNITVYYEMGHFSGFIVRPQGKFKAVGWLADKGSYTPPQAADHAFNEFDIFEGRVCEEMKKKWRQSSNSGKNNNSGSSGVSTPPVSSSGKGPTPPSSNGGGADRFRHF